MDFLTIVIRIHNFCGNILEGFFFGSIPGAICRRIYERIPVGILGETPTQASVKFSRKNS